MRNMFQRRRPLRRWMPALMMVGAVILGRVVFATPKPAERASATVAEMTPVIERTEVLPAEVADKDCAAFATQQDAQTFLAESGPGDPHRLAGDNDGIACARLP
jgi:hypothetical protein